MESSTFGDPEKVSDLAPTAQRMVDFVAEMIASVVDRQQENDQMSRVFRRFGTLIMPRIKADLQDVPEEAMRLWLRGLQQNLNEILGPDQAALSPGPEVPAVKEVAS